jgi:hypothetical protein
MKSKLLIFLAVVACLPLVTLAGGGQGFTPLVGIPGLPSDGSFDGYVDALYALAISIAALVAVVKIVLAGAKYMMDDIVTHKSEAKEDIKNALIGLLIIIGAVIILNTINSDLTNLAITAPPVVVDNSTPDPIQTIVNDAEEAIARNSPWVNSTCPSYGIGNEVANSVGLGESCQSDCRRLDGQFSWGYVYHTCSYAQDVADQCNPQQTVLCCETVKNGDWDWDATSNNCSGFDTDEERAASCAESGRTWDAANNTCRTTGCNQNTDQLCCELHFEGTYENGACSTGENIITNETTCLAQGSGWTYTDEGRCIQLNTEQYEFQPVVGNGDPYAYCLRLGEGWEYSEQNNNCQRFTGN